ncbi:uncharacterized protein BDZ99DRAFT_464040 [Mytilinidion resinicola]|uniref:Heterokaryon incompatibility domain-containing protein n=1 Tax=Mytilinidion resinicola TaxID=574789 RepID=A0A6A6YH47_9PEZI|nr:uncharacterized protein BDZ99DRAFT_464040 [Mytilinidion resinicola]KAF2808142.1 hypothetical protein BDZ99DRAFT_464040 [Mytilinidion resinicola]
MHLMRSKYQSKTSGHTLLDLVLLTRGFECTDPRDKVFALVGLAKDVESTDWEVTPDYSRPTEDVYKLFALWSITKRRDLQVLALTPDPLMPPTLSLPSWVPDLKRSNKADPLPVMPNLLSAASEASWTQGLTVRLKQRDVFHADSSAFESTIRGVSSMRNQPSVSLEDNNTELRVHGRKVDEIKEVGSVANFAIVPYYDPNMSGQPVSVGSSYTRINDWLRETLMITTRGTGALSFEVFQMWWPTLSCGMDASGRPLERKWLYAFTVAATQLGFRIPDYGWRTYVPLDGFLEFKDPVSAMSRLLNYHEPAVIRWAQYRRFCCTAAGRLGLVPGGAAPGDVICVLVGGRVPFILRPSTDGSYKIIGEAYIHDLMHGEAMKLSGKNVREGSFALH